MPVKHVVVLLSRDRLVDNAGARSVIHEELFTGMLKSDGVIYLGEPELSTFFLEPRALAIVVAEHELKGKPRESLKNRRRDDVTAVNNEGRGSLFKDVHRLDDHPDVFMCVRNDANERIHTVTIS